MLLRHWPDRDFWDISTYNKWLRKMWQLEDSIHAQWPLEALEHSSFAPHFLFLRSAVSDRWTFSRFLRNRAWSDSRNSSFRRMSEFMEKAKSCLFQNGVDIPLLYLITMFTNHMAEAVHAGSHSASRTNSLCSLTAGTACGGVGSKHSKRDCAQGCNKEMETRI